MTAHLTARAGAVAGAPSLAALVAVAAASHPHLSTTHLKRLRLPMLHVPRFSLFCFNVSPSTSGTHFGSALPQDSSAAALTFVCHEKVPRTLTAAASGDAVQVASRYSGAVNVAGRRRPHWLSPFQTKQAECTYKGATAAAANFAPIAASDARALARAFLYACPRQICIPSSLQGDVFSEAPRGSLAAVRVDTASLITAEAAISKVRPGPLCSSFYQAAAAACDWRAGSNCLHHLFTAATRDSIKRLGQLYACCAPVSPCTFSTKSADPLSVGASILAFSCTASFAASAAPAALSVGTNRSGVLEQRQRDRSERQPLRMRRRQWRKQPLEEKTHRCKAAVWGHNVCIGELHARKSSQATALHTTLTYKDRTEEKTTNGSDFVAATDAAWCSASNAASRVQLFGFGACHRWSSTCVADGDANAATADCTPAALKISTPHARCCLLVAHGRAHLEAGFSTKVDPRTVGNSSRSGGSSDDLPARAATPAPARASPWALLVAADGAAAVAREGISAFRDTEAAEQHLPSTEHNNNVRVDDMNSPKKAISSAEKPGIGIVLQQEDFLSALQPYADEAIFLKERYGPPKDPSALLIEAHRLTREERIFQKLFIVLPGAAFLLMLATPVVLVRYHVQKLQARMAYTEEMAEELASDVACPAFQDCDFSALRNVIEQPTHAFVFYFHPESHASQVMRPLLQDIASLFERSRVRVTIATLNLAEKSVPDAVRRMFPAALAPHGELLLPFAFGGQQPALQLYAGEWEAQSIVEALAREVPSAAGALNAAQELNDWTEKLSNCLFALRFVDDRPGDTAATQQQGKVIQRDSQRSSSGGASAAMASRFVEEQARSVGLAGGGLRKALRDCEFAREQLRCMVEQQKEGKEENNVWRGTSSDWRLWDAASSSALSRKNAAQETKKH